MKPAAGSAGKKKARWQAGSSFQAINTQIMNALISTVNPVTMTSLELVMGSLMAKPVKGYDWYCQAFEVIDTCPGLAGFPSLKSALIGSVCSAYQSAANSGGSNDASVNELYIMESEAMAAIKVGRTSIGAEKRASQIKVGCPDIRVYKVFQGLAHLEPFIHRELKNFCVGGEWFSVSPEVAESVIQRVSEGGAA